MLFDLGVWNGGHTGDARILGIPSGRELHRIPGCCPDPMVGWGWTNESKAVMGTKPDGTLEFTTGDTHHIHCSYKDGIYDGKYAWVNDKLNARLVRIRMDYMVTDKILKLPHVQGFHGIFPDKRDPVDPKSVLETPRSRSFITYSVSFSVLRVIISS